MTKDTRELTNLDPRIQEFQNNLYATYASENATVEKGQIVFVGSSSTEIFPIKKMQLEQNLGLKKKIYNRGVRATTTADLLEYINLLIFDLRPDKIFINIGANDVGFNVPKSEFLSNFEKILLQIKDKLPESEVYTIAFYPVNTADNFGEEKDEHNQFYEHRSNDLLQKESHKLEKITNKFGYSYIDLNDGLLNENGELKKEYTFDGAHMLPKAYQIIFNNMKKYLN